MSPVKVAEVFRYILKVWAPSVPVFCHLANISNMPFAPYVFAGINKERDSVSVVVPVTGVPDAVFIATIVGPFPLTTKSPLPNTELPLIVLMFVPLTSAFCLPLNVFQSVELNAPFVEVLAVAMLIAGVEPPVDAIGAVPVTSVTPPEDAAASMIS
jgi:hypothetical protein